MKYQMWLTATIDIGKGVCLETDEKRMELVQDVVTVLNNRTDVLHDELCNSSKKDETAWPIRRITFEESNPPRRKK